MRKLLFLLALLPFTANAQAVYEAPYGVANTFHFLLYNTDGTLDVDEVDGGTEVSVSCDEGAEGTATNDFVDEGTFYSIALTATEMSCDRIAVVVAATDTNVFFIRTTEGGVPDKFHAVADATGSTTSTDLTGSASATDDFYNGYLLKVYDVSGTAWYEATITDYVGSTNIATHTAISAAVVSGDAVLVKNEKRSVLTVDANGTVDANLVSADADSIDASALAADAVDEIWDEVVEDQGSTYTARCVLTSLFATLAGEWSTSGIVATFQDPGGNANRVVGSIDGNTRGSITITCP